MLYEVITVGAGKVLTTMAKRVDKGGIGGQATSSSLIRNYLGFPRGVSGRQLAQNAYSQARNNFV